MHDHDRVCWQTSSVERHLSINKHRYDWLKSPMVRCLMILALSFQKKITLPVRECKILVHPKWLSFKRAFFIFQKLQKTIEIYYLYIFELASCCKKLNDFYVWRSSCCCCSNRFFTLHVREYKIIVHTQYDCRLNRPSFIF